MNNIASDYRDAAERAKRPPQSPPCGSRQYQSHDDLCAQWKAADAASDAAWWAATGTWIGAISGLFVLGALGLAYQANAISRDTARRQLRSYLTVERASIFNLAIGVTPYAQIDFINAGQTPAYEVNTDTRFGWHVIPPSQEWFEATGSSDAEKDGTGSVGPQRKILTYPALPDPWSSELADALAAGKIALYAFGKVIYRDAFGEAHVVGFRYYHDHTSRDGKVYNCPSGNFEN